MLGIRNRLQARRNVSEDIPSAHVLNLERARHVRLALQNLDPPQDYQESHSRSLTPCSDLSSTSSKKVIEHKKKYRPPPLTLDVQHHPALQRSGSSLHLTEMKSRHTKSQHSLPIIQTVPLPLPTQAYRSSIAFNSPNSSPTSTLASSPTTTVTSDPNCLTVPSVHPPLTPLSPLTPPPLSPSTTKRKRFSRLCRKFGESPPSELVFGEPPVPVGRKVCAQNNAHFAHIVEEGIAFFASKESPFSWDLDTSSTSTLGTCSSDDLHQPSSVLNDAEKLHHISREHSTVCVLEKKGRRITQRNYEDVLMRLRMLWAKVQVTHTFRLLVVGMLILIFIIALSAFSSLSWCTIIFEGCTLIVLIIGDTTWHSYIVR